MPLKLIRRNNKGSYYLRGSVAGTNIYESTFTSDRRAAEAIRIRTEAEILKRASLGREATTTFAEAALNYMDSGGEARFLTPILNFFGSQTRLKDINNSAINKAAEKLYPGCAPATINRNLITPISAIIALAVEDELCHPVKLRRRRVTAKKTRWLTPEEFERFDAELGSHLKPIINFMIGTGSRARETLSLQASTLYLSTGQALLEDTKNGTPRMVRIPPRTAQVMQAAHIPDAGAVFRTHKGAPYVIRDNTGGQIKNAFNKARDRAGLGRDVTPHTLRHTWATWFYAQTRDFGELLDLGGWSKADVANIYRKIAPDDLAQRLIAHGWDFRTAGRLQAIDTTPLRIVRN